MAISQVKLKNGKVVDIHAKAFSGTRKINISGDVTGSNNAWNGKDECDILVTIGDKKVTESKLATDSVSTEKMKDGSVTIAKLASSAFGNSDVASDNDGHVASHAQVVSYVTRILSGYGQNYGVMTVAAINAMTLENLHNGDLVSVTGISDKSPANVITLGNITVRNGSNLIFHKSGSGASTTGVWQLMDGEFKLTQSALEFTCNGAKTVAKISQNENGDISVAFQDIQPASATQKGLMSAADFTKLAALPNNNDLNTALGKKADKVTGATSGNFAGLDANGNLKDSGFNSDDFLSSKSSANKDEVVAAALGELEARLESVEAREVSGDIVVDSVAMQEFPLVGGKSMVLFGAAAPSVIPDYEGQLFVDTANKVVYVATGYSSVNDWSALKKRQTAIAGNQGGTKKTLTGIAQDVDGKITPVFDDIEGLSDNNYSDAEKQKVANATTHIGNGDIHVTKEQKDSWTGKQDKLTNTDAQIQDAVSKAHSHANKAVLDGITSDKVTGWDSAAKDRHSHTNKDELDKIATGDKAKWDAKQDALTAGQMAAVDSGITSDKVGGYDSHLTNTTVHITAAERTKWNGKQDKLTSTDAQIQDAVSKAHEHSNKTVLDGISQDKINSWDNKSDSFEWMTSDEAVALWDAAWNAAT